MPDLTVPLDALLFMFLLGLRHGLDPDHIAMVDSLTFGRSGPDKPTWTAGALFAAGHGVAVTVSAIVMQTVSRELTLAEPWATLAGWLPVVLLAVVGTLNLHSLLRPGRYRLRGAVPAPLLRFCACPHPLAAFGIGILFALVFDTASQLSAWGYAGSASQGAGAAIVVGLAFTAGMVAVDALDGYLMHCLLTNPDPTARERYRRRVGWLTVAAAYGVALYGAAHNVLPAIAVSELTLTLFGAFMVSAFVLLGLWNRWQHTRQAAAPSNF